MSNKKVGPYSSYKSLFKIQHVIYKLGNIRLWGFGVSFDQLLTGAVVAIIFGVLYTVFPLLNYFFINKWIVIIICSLGSMWASARYELAGKSILMWSFGIVAWLVRSKFSARGRSIKKPKYRKYGIKLYAASKQVDVSETGTISCMSPAFLQYTDIKSIKTYGAHKIKFNTAKNTVLIIPRNKASKNASNHGDIHLLPKKKITIIETSHQISSIENDVILSQPAPSPKRLSKHKSRHALALHVDTSYENKIKQVNV